MPDGDALNGWLYVVKSAKHRRMHDEFYGDDANTTVEGVLWSDVNKSLAQQKRRHENSSSIVDENSTCCNGGSTTVRQKMVYLNLHSCQFASSINERYTFRSPDCTGMGKRRSGTDQQRCDACQDEQVAKKLRQNCIDESGSRVKGPSWNAQIDHVIESTTKTRGVLKRQSKKIHKQGNKLRKAAARKVQADGFAIKDPDQQDEVIKLYATAHSLAHKGKDKFIDQLFAPNSPERYIWDDQLRNARAVGKKAGKRRGVVKFHPATIRLALWITNKLGNKAYDKLSSVLFLPSSRYMREFRNLDDVSVGPMLGTIQAMSDAAAGLNFSEWDYHVTLAYDAMVCRQEMVFSPHTGQLIGICSEQDMSVSVNIVRSEFQLAMKSSAGDLFESEDEIDPTQLPLAKHHLVFYATSLGYQKFSFPVARYNLETIDAGTMLNYFRRCVTELYGANFIVVAGVGDGAQENRCV